MSIIIRTEQKADFTAVDRLIGAAFAGKPYSSGTEGLIAQALRASGDLTLSLIAERQGEIVGQIMFSPVIINEAPSSWHCLGPVAVSPQCQKEGIGSRLIEEGLARLRATGSHGCVLVGDPGYYSRFGFRPVLALSARDVPAEYFQVLPFETDVPVGTLDFHPAFETSSAD
ncbi:MULTISPECIES: GNAT family N-acetyltransferase [unclassified Sinorhizobium]|uniref:GNAT family N-acetyltransferase n=1 Tax=unclassified Sinorhizobium TaxID=2613772 RepID=UPI0035235A2E